MDNLKQRGRAYSVVLNDSGANLFKDSNFIFKKMLYSDIDILFIALIKHEYDLIDEYTYKTPHYHIVFTTDGIHSVGSMLNELVRIFGCNSNQVTIQKCNSVPMMVRYLVHLDDIDKHRYDLVDIVSNRYDLVNQYYDMKLKIVDINDLISIMDSHKGLRDLMTTIGLDNYKKWRLVIQDLRKEW